MDLVIPEFPKLVKHKLYKFPNDTTGKAYGMFTSKTVRSNWLLVASDIPMVLSENDTPYFLEVHRMSRKE